MPAQVRQQLQAILLIGGEGTRLRPLTLSRPKPLLPVANRPFLAYQFDLLRAHGVRDVVLATSYQASAFKTVFGDGRRWGVKIRYVHEKTPLGTGGAVKNAERWVQGTTLIFNGDVFNDLDLGAFLSFHRDRKADVSIALTPVEDPTAFGLVETEPDGRVRRFLEKPSPEEVTCNTVNAGTYLFEPMAFGKIPKGAVYSLERGLFPSLLAEGARLFGFNRGGYWMDIGTIEKYLQAHKDLLNGRIPHQLPGRRKGTVWLEKGARLAKGAFVDGAACLGAGAQAAAGARLKGSVSLGAGCRVGEDAVIEDSVLLEGVSVGPRARVKGSVIGPGVEIGHDAALENAAVGPGAVWPPYSRA